MKNKLRVFVYSGLTLPLLIGIVLVGSMNPQERGGFLTDYSKTLGRMLNGKWSLSELTEAERRRDHQRWRNGRREFNGNEIFRRLDNDGDGVLQRPEIGNRLAISLGIDVDGDNAGLSAEQFQTALYGSWGAEPAVQLAEDKQQAETSQAKAPASTAEITTKLIADDLLSPDHVTKVEIDIPDNDWLTLCNQSRDFRSAVENPLAKPYTNFKADITINGVLIKDVAVRKKAFIGSQDTVRPSLKVKFDEFVEQAPIEGLDRLTLNNNKQDGALISQFLTYRLFRAAGIHAPRCSFATVTVNGKYLGVYSHVESVRKPFLLRVFGEDSGNLYEGTLTDLYPKSIEWMEAKTNKQEDDRTKLTELATVLAKNTVSLKEVERIVNLDNFLRYWAVESMINFWDGYSQNQNNYFMYDHPGDGRFYFMPWGADSCFSNRRRSRGNSRSIAVGATSILANRLYHLDGIPERYRTTMLELLNTVWNEDDMLQETNRLENLLRDHIDIGQIGSVLQRDDLRRFIRERRERLMRELDDDWPAMVAAAPRTPRYDEQVGSAQGVISLGEGGVSELVDASLTLNDETTQFESSAVRRAQDSQSITNIILDGIHDAQLLRLILAVDEHGNLPSMKVTGVLEDGGWKRNRKIFGTVRIDTELSRVTFDVKIKETRGGFADRGR